MSRHLCLLPATALCCLPAIPGHAAFAVQASQIAASCAACHRVDAHDSGIPAIAGMDEHRMLQQMAAYRLETHGDQIMHVVANALTPEETEAVARYLAAQHSAAAQR